MDSLYVQGFIKMGFYLLLLVLSGLLMKLKVTFTNQIYNDQSVSIAYQPANAADSAGEIQDESNNSNFVAAFNLAIDTSSIADSSPDYSAPRISGSPVIEPSGTVINLAFDEALVFDPNNVKDAFSIRIGDDTLTSADFELLNFEPPAGGAATAAMTGGGLQITLLNGKLYDIMQPAGKVGPPCACPV